MSYIKTTNIIIDTEITLKVRTVICPYCNTGLKSIPLYVTAMTCWNCKKEFRLEQDKNKFISNKKTETVYKTITHGSL